MQLSIRMKNVSSLVTPGECLADIGTDHGYIPIELVREGRVKRALAMDINEGPLLRAEENIRRFGLEKQIETRLSDGAKALKRNEADRAVIAGMGGGLVIKILTEGAEVFETVQELILQPQSELSRVRKFLQGHAYRIDAENMVIDEGKYYPMMRAVHGSMEPLSEEEALYGPLLLKNGNPVLRRFLEKEQKNFENILRGLKKETGENAARRISEIEERLSLIQKAKERMK
ncbi:MAG: class I SAM-dependent methyltransferase [Eubacteriales bacterium]|nr:class I SAM-dependent methyltransferase [Eubacteriales bacterium]